MVWPWVMPYSVIDLGVGVACTFCTKLPDGPVRTVLFVEELDQDVCWVAVGSFGVGGGWARRRNDYDCSDQLVS